MVDKLVKALDGLKNLQFTTSVEDKNIRYDFGLPFFENIKNHFFTVKKGETLCTLKHALAGKPYRTEVSPSCQSRMKSNEKFKCSYSKKEKMFFCVLATDVMVSVKPPNLQNLPVFIENIMNLCDDNDSDVRMVADESLNRVIMSLSESSMPKIQVELHKIIKKNGPARCLKAAISRFGQLSQYIRPNKGKVHVQMLVPCLIEISKREEESIHETLATSFESIFKVLGVFVQDNSLKSLIKAFLHNLSNKNPVIRRCSATCIIKLIQYCRKPHIFNSYVLNSLLDCVVPVCEDNSSDLILGVLGCLRLLLPTLTSVKCDEGISGSFGLRKKQEDSYFSVDRLIQTYELCLHYTKSKDHNIVAAALETLSQILQSPPQQLESFFLSPAGFSRSYIQSFRENKLCSRSGSEMSVGCSLPAMDESLLLDDSEISSQFSHLVSKQNLSKQRSKTKEKSNISKDDSKILENPFQEKSTDKSYGSQTALDDSDTESSIAFDIDTPPLLLMAGQTDSEDKVPDDFVDISSTITRSESLDNLCCPNEIEGFNNFFVDDDIGSFTDAAVPLIYCVRHLAASFLLDSSPSSLKSDRNVRVSIKSLAFSCISAAVKLYPVVLKMNLSKSQINGRCQEVSNILLFSDHNDPQIRGCVSTLIGTFIQSVLLECKGFPSIWLNNEKSVLSCENLVQILLKGLKDKSSMCNRMSLAAIKMFINMALMTPYNKQFLPLLEYFTAMTSNSYWLVKVKLVEVLSDLSYGVIQDIQKSNVYQKDVIDYVLFPLLEDEDARVRLAASEALVRIVTMLCDEKSPVLNCTKSFTCDLNKWLKARNRFGLQVEPCLPFLGNSEDLTHNQSIEFSLSNVVAKLTKSLMICENKHFLFGCVEVLKLLTEKYPPTIYLKAWNCSKSKSVNSGDFLTSELVCYIYSIVVTSPMILDLTALSNATVLLGNLFAGHAISNLKTNYHLIALSEEFENEGSLWNVFESNKLSILAEEIFTHLLKILNLYSSLVEESPLSSIAESTIAASALAPLLSPIKKPGKKSYERGDEKKGKTTQSSHYHKLQQLLKNAYTSYKVSLDKAVSEKFLNLLDSTLYTLSILLEVSTIQETGRCADEILSYLRRVIGLRSTSAVICVNQLLKSLLGTNLAFSWEEKKLPILNYQGVNLFDTLFQLPPEFLSEKIHKRININSLECQNLNGRLRRSDRKILVKNTDNWLATHIRLFEPLLVKSLQLYTTTGNVKLQSSVLQLLNQLIQLRINYCFLEEKQVFVGFVLKQFELIEQGQIPEVELLLPHIFKFLVLLSYEKHHSKSIIGVPKILQLCDGLMASDQSVQTHCIPALVPVVEDVFLLRNVAEDKELETQREVLLSMLLRVADFPQVMDMLTRILSDSRAVEDKEKWKRWSRQVVEVMLNLASQDRLKIETFEGQNSFINLMSALSPNVLRPIDPLLKVLFVEPNNYNCCLTLNRWLSRVTVVLETILFVKEDVFLNRLEEVSPNVNLNNFVPTENLFFPDPFNVDAFFQVYEPAETVARFLMKIISVIANRIVLSFSTSLQLQRKLSTFFICVYHIIKSGTFHRVTNAMKNVMIREQESVSAIFFLFKKLSFLCPLLTCQFSYLLSLLNFCGQTYWSDILRVPDTLSTKLVQWCGVISLTDYMCDNSSDTDTLHYLIKNNIREILLLSHEIPVKELLMTIRRRKPDWNFLLDAISTCDFDHEPLCVEKVLRLLEVSDPGHSGKLLVLLVKKYMPSPRLALSLLAGSIACRQIEFLLTLPREKVMEEIDKASFDHLMIFFRSKNSSKRHFNFWSLFERLVGKVFGSVATNQSGVIPVENLSQIQLNEDWFISQVKQRCCQKNSLGPEIACLLSKLSLERISEIFEEPDFNVKILKDCLTYLMILRKKCKIQEGDINQSEALVFSNHSLFKATKKRLLALVKSVSDEVVKGRKEMRLEENSPEVLDKILENETLVELVWKVAPSLTLLLDIMSLETLQMEEKWLDELTEFGFFLIAVLQRKNIFEENMLNGLTCFSALLKTEKLKSDFCKTTNRKKLKNCINHVFSIVKNSIPAFRLNRFEMEEDLTNGDDVVKLRFLLSFITAKSASNLLPKYLMNAFRELIINLCRMPELSLHVLNVPEMNDLQDLECLENFIGRFSIIGWGNKQQFEEIWVALLAVLGFNTQGDIPAEETGFIVLASAVAVEGITTLFKKTMLDSRRKKLIHHGRDYLAMKNIYDKLPLIGGIYKSDEFNDREYHFMDNLEITKRDDGYIHGLLSVEYLWTAVKQITSQIDLYERHTNELARMGLDLPSCTYLLTELYSQWIYQTCPDIKIITCSLKSAIVVSDLFTDISQFQWLLSYCLKIEEIISGDDTVLLPSIIIGSAKAAAIVLPDLETCDKIRKLMLKSENPACRLATVQGLLYLLQSYVVCYAVNHTALPPPGSTFQREEISFVTYIVDTFLPVTLEVIQEFKVKTGRMDEEYERCHWSLIFYLLQNYQSSLGDLKEELIGFIFATVKNKNCSESLMGLLVRGIERLLLTTVIDEAFKDQVSKVSLDVISQNSVSTCRHGLQLLTVLSFLDKRTKDIRQLVTGQEDPEKVMKDMEKINVLFEKLKKSYPKEAEVVGEVLSYILMDFTASDVLTKVIQEFLSSQQPHQKILAGLLFKVFERAELSLLEDWVVFSLPSFIQGMPISMSIWILNCFFVSASSESWLRSLFPLVQSRIRMAEPEDKQLLCLAGVHFYKQLKQNSQKTSFVQALEKVSKMDAVFIDLLSALT